MRADRQLDEVVRLEEYGTEMDLEALNSQVHDPERKRTEEEEKLEKRIATETDPEVRGAVCVCVCVMCERVCECVCVSVCRMHVSVFARACVVAAFVCVSVHERACTAKSSPVAE